MTVHLYSVRECDEHIAHLEHATDRRFASSLEDMADARAKLPTWRLYRAYAARLAALENVAEKAAWSVHALRNGGLPIKLTELEQALSALSPDRTTEETGT